MPPTTTTMVETETTPRPRRSARDKKQSQPFLIGGSSSPSKRKRQEIDTDGEEPLTDLEEDIDHGDDTAAEDDYVAPRKPKATSKGKGKARGPPAPKKPRAAKAAAKGTTRRRRKKADGNAFDATKPSLETKVADDNALFNAIVKPAATLQSTVEDFLESLAHSPEAALADLINCVLRACGSNDSVDSDRAVDYDGVVDALDDFTDILKEENSPTYPLTSKLPAFKKFRKSLSEFLDRLVSSAAELGSLYSSDLLPTLQTWVVAMSSSQLRSFRHTATVIALEVETALCDVAAAVEKEAEVITRQREGERKRKAKGATTGRDKEFESKATEIKGRRTKMTEFLKEFFDGVFVHRYRDLDPNIRAECVHAMGNWLKKFPGHFLDGQYLRYIGWVLSDSNTHVRLEAVKSLISLYDKEDFIVSLHHFTERFKPRLVEMATGDTELAVRVAVIQALGLIDGHGILEEDQRETLSLLAFDEEAKVRKAVGSFVRGVWEETVEQRLVGKKAGKKEKERAGVKALALLLVKWSRALEKADADVVEDEDGEISTSQADRRSIVKDVASVVNPHQKGRIALAVEALWDEVDAVSDWEALLELLLLDHSARIDTAGDGTPVSSRRKKKTVTEDTVVDEAWRLEEVEEAVLLEVLVAALRKSKAEAASGKKGEEEAVASEITRALIKNLPSLFAKHQTDENRIADVLLIPELMNMEMFLEMRMITAYESLWDDVIKQFMSHSSPTVLSHSMAAIRHLMNATSLSNTNSAKILELEDELSSSLRDAVAGRDELEVASFSEDEARSLGAICARLAALAGTRDMTTWMDEDEGGKQSSAWDIICALAERGRLGYREEEMMIDRALHVLTLHIIWKARGLMSGIEPSTEEERFKESLREQRDILLEKLTEYAVGTQSNTIENVKRAAFQNLMTLHVLFCSAATVSPNGDQLPLASLALSMVDEVQYRCSGFIQSEIERYAEELGAAHPPRNPDSDEDSQSDSDSGLEDSAEASKPKIGKGKNHKSGKRSKNIDDPRLKSRSKLEQEYVFNTTMSTFLRAIRAGVIDVRHGGVLLAHYGRLGSSFDLSVRVMVDILRVEGMYSDNGELVATVIIQALRDSFLLLLDHIVETDSHVLALSKLLASCLVVRGAQLSVLRRLDSQHIIEVHTGLLSWITKQIAGYELNKNKKSRKTAVVFFRVLLQLLNSIQSRDALKIKAHLDQVIAQAKIEISPTSKTWEPYRAYEKKLVTAISKDKAKKDRGKGVQSAELVTTDDDEEIEVQGLVDEPSMLLSQNYQQPKPKPAYRRQTSELGSPLTNESIERDVDALQSPDNGLPTTPTTPKASNGNAAHISSSSNIQPVQSTVSHATNGVVQNMRKRSHAPSDTEEDISSEHQVGGDEDIQDNSGNGRVSATQTSEIFVRRKRVRH